MSPETDTRHRTELAPDDVFELLVHVANTTDVEMGVTLHVNGLIITGKLISGTTYWAESAEELRAQGAGPTQAVEAMASSMDGLAERYREVLGQDADTEPMTAFIHLRGARTLSPQGPIPSDGALWRGRLASVDGFSFGELRPRSESDSTARR